MVQRERREAKGEGREGMRAQEQGGRGWPKARRTCPKTGEGEKGGWEHHCPAWGRPLSPNPGH